MRVLTRRTELTDRLDKLTRIVCTSEFLLMLFSTTAEFTLETILIPDNGHVFLLRKDYLNSELEPDIGKICAVLPISEGDICAYTETLNSVCYGVYENVLSGLMYFAEEYAIFNTVNKQLLCGSVLVDAISEMIEKENSDFTVIDSIIESIFENVDMDAVSESCQPCALYETTMVNMLLMLKHPSIEKLIQEIFLEEVNLRRYLGSHKLTADNSFISCTGEVELMHCPEFENVTSGFLAQEKMETFTDDNYGINTVPIIEGFVNGVYYEGRYKIEDERIEDVKEFIFNGG